MGWTAGTNWGTPDSWGSTSGNSYSETISFGTAGTSGSGGSWSAVGSSISLTSDGEEIDETYKNSAGEIVEEVTVTSPSGFGDNGTITSSDVSETVTVTGYRDSGDTTFRLEESLYTWAVDSLITELENKANAAGAPEAKIAPHRVDGSLSKSTYSTTAARTAHLEQVMASKGATKLANGDYEYRGDDIKYIDKYCAYSVTYNAEKGAYQLYGDTVNGTVTYASYTADTRSDLENWLSNHSNYTEVDAISSNGKDTTTLYAGAIDPGGNSISITYNSDFSTYGTDTAVAVISEEENLAETIDHEVDHAVNSIHSEALCDADSLLLNNEIVISRHYRNRKSIGNITPKGKNRCKSIGDV